jgi:hypothetical protein
VRHGAGPATETTSTRTGFAHGPLSATSLASVAQADEVLQLVTPVRIQEPSVSHLFDQSGFATLELRLVPEPGPFAALASGAALAGVLGAARRRRRTGP